MLTRIGCATVAKNQKTKSGPSQDSVDAKKFSKVLPVSQMKERKRQIWKQKVEVLVFYMYLVSHPLF